IVSAPDQSVVRVFDIRGTLLMELTPFGKGVKRGSMRVVIVSAPGGVREVVAVKPPSSGGVASVQGMDGFSLQAYERAFKGGAWAMLTE
ncbi:MAG: hypothetical protein RLZZ324_868, partial [Candidatus Parcubacteria bacterium]